jgi:hypothetical protein
MRGKSAAVTPDSTILFCRCSQYGAPAGFRILLKPQSGPEVVLLEESERSNPSARHWARIADRIQSLYGIQTRLVKQVTSASGLNEEDWSAATDRKQWLKITPAIIAGLFPYLGIAARYFTSKWVYIVLAGLLLFTLQALIFASVYRRQAEKSESAALLLFVGALSFVCFYSACALMTNLALVRYWPGH